MAARSPRCRSSRRRAATSRRTSRRTSSRSPTARSTSSPTCSSPGVRPAINVGISVSRVGGNAQIKAMKKVAGRLRLDLAQFRALEAFAQFGSELDKASQQQLARGARVVEILKQPQYQPQPVERQVVAIYVVTGGYLDEYPVEDARRFVEEVRRYVESRHPESLRRSARPATCPMRPRPPCAARSRSSVRRSCPPRLLPGATPRSVTRNRPTRSSPTWAGIACPPGDPSPDEPGADEPGPEDEGAAA